MDRLDPADTGPMALAISSSAAKQVEEGDEFAVLLLMFLACVAILSAAVGIVL